MLVVNRQGRVARCDMSPYIQCLELLFEIEVLKLYFGIFEPNNRRVPFEKSLIIITENQYRKRKSNRPTFELVGVGTSKNSAVGTTIRFPFLIFGIWLQKPLPPPPPPLICALASHVRPPTPAQQRKSAAAASWQSPSTLPASTRLIFVLRACSFAHAAADSHAPLISAAARPQPVAAASSSSSSKSYE